MTIAQQTDNPPPATYGTSHETHTEFQRLTEQWKDAYNSKEAKNFIPLYAENARSISSHVPGYEAIGRDAIIAHFQREMMQGGYIDSINILSVEVACDIATVITRYDATNSGVTVSGRNLLVSKKIDERWQIVIHLTVIQD